MGDVWSVGWSSFCIWMVVVVVVAAAAVVAVSGGEGWEFLLFGFVRFFFENMQYL